MQRVLQLHSPAAPPDRGLSQHQPTACPQCSCRPTPWQLSSRGQPLRRHRTSRQQRVPPVHAGPTELGNLVDSEAALVSALKDNDVIVVDWMARWCRKCIYLKPKITKMMEEDFPGIPIVFVDVNAVPGNLVYEHGIRKMPTLTIHVHGEKLREHVAAEGGLNAIKNIRQMIKDFVDSGGLETDN